MHCILKPRVQDAGSTLPKVPTLIFFQDQLSTQIAMLFATGLSFVKVLCTQSESTLPILMEKNKNHQITLPKGRIGFSSLDVSEKDEPKYQTLDP